MTKFDKYIQCLQNASTENEKISIFQKMEDDAFWLKSSYARGYVSRKDNVGRDRYTDGRYYPAGEKGYITIYTGRYGHGIIYHEPAYNTTQYYVKSYYLIED